MTDGRPSTGSLMVAQLSCREILGEGIDSNSWRDSLLFGAQVVPRAAFHVCESGVQVPFLAQMTPPRKPRLRHAQSSLDLAGKASSMRLASGREGAATDLSLDLAGCGPRALASKAVSLTLCWPCSVSQPSLGFN